MASVPYELHLLDAFGRQQPTLGGIPIDGPVRGARNLTYVLEGGIVDKVGTGSFEVPLAETINQAITPNTQLAIYEPAVSTTAPTATLVVTNVAPRRTKDGLFATITCEDLTNEISHLMPSTGFSTAVGSDGVTPIETTTQVLNRLLSLATDPALPLVAWTGVNTVTNLDGLTFNTAKNASIFGGAVKLAGERFAHVKRGPGRTVVIGRPGDAGWGASGITLTRGGSDPSGMLSGGPPAELRAIEAITVGTSAKVENDLVPTGGGTGIGQLTLRTLYGLAAFAGFDPAYPIYRRPTQDGGVSNTDGYDYYLQDTDSIYGNAAKGLPAYGRHQVPYTKSDINVYANNNGVSTDLDRQTAAATLYQVALAHLRYYRQPITTLTIVTEGRGDLRGIAGQSVYVSWHDPVQVVQPDGTTTTVDGLPIEGAYIVVGHQRAWGNGDCRDTWTLNTTGQWAMDGAAVLAGIQAQVDSFHFATATQQSYRDVPIDTFMDADHPITRLIRGNNGILQTVQATLDVTFAPVYSNTQPRIHQHQVTIPALKLDVNQLAHDVAALNHDIGANVTHDIGTNVTHDTNLRQIGVTAPGATSSGGGFNADITIGVSDANGQTGLSNVSGKLLTGGYLGLWFPGGGTIHTASGLSISSTNHTHGIPPLNVTASLPATTGGTGGVVKPTTNGTGGTVKATAGGTGGKVVPTTGGTGGYVLATSGGAGGTTIQTSNSSGTETGMQWGWFAGPAPPSKCDVYVDNVRVGTLSPSNLSIDLTPYWGGTQDHTLTLTGYPADPTTNPRGLQHVAGLLQIRQITTNANIAAH